MMTQQSTLTSDQTAPLNLREQHRLLDIQFDELLQRAATGDWRECDAIWDGFSRALGQHMADEERRLFPDFARIGPMAAKIVQQLREEHEELRSRLQSIGVAIQLHAARAEELQDLVRVLREHAAREGQSIYPWLDEQAAGRETPFGCDEAIV